MTTTSEAASLLLAAREGQPFPRFAEILPADRNGAYAIQDACLQKLGPVAGWKVGAKGPGAEPTCAPLPLRGILTSGVMLHGPPWLMRGVEVEVAVRLGRDLVPPDAALTVAALASAVDCVMPAIEVVETRLADWKGSDPLAQLADLQSHGALVLGQPAAVPVSGLDLRTVRASLAFNGTRVASTTGGNPAADIWRMLAWLARHCAQRGQPLRAGQVITTGSCTGMLFAPEGAMVSAELAGFGNVTLQF